MQLSYNPVDYHFAWTADWYTWDAKAAHKAARLARDAAARKWRAEGARVRSFSLPGQLISRGGIGSRRPHLEFWVTGYYVDVQMD